MLHNSSKLRVIIDSNNNHSPLSFQANLVYGNPESLQMLLDRASDMKPEQLYHELRNVADRLGLVVLEHNFRTTGIRVRSGFCKVKNQSHCIIDKHLRAGKKAEVLAECLMLFPHDSIYILPAVREYMDAFKPRRGRKQGQPTPE